jgi:hypothetical protein
MEHHRMADTTMPTGGSPGKIPSIPFTSDSKHVPWLMAGTLSAAEDTVASKIALLIVPSGRARPARILLDLDGSLDLAHQLIASAGQLRRGGSGDA